MKKLILMLLGLFPLWGYAQTLQLKNGVNQQDLNADGVPDLIIRTRWDVMSAHSADKYLIAIATSTDEEGFPKGYYDVGLEQDSNPIFWTSEGADCILSGYKFRLNQHKILEMEYYKRDFGENYADSQPVTITTYRLTNRHGAALGGIGLTPAYFEQIAVRRTLKKYCDVRALMK